MNKKNLLLIFTKNPVAGKVKTRLARDLGNEKALQVYNFLLQHSMQVTSSLKVEKHVYYSDEVASRDIWDNAEFEKKQQHGSNLGVRMENAFREGFAEGFENIIIIGTDLYDIDSSDLENAFRELEQHDVVIGPAQDGGYYLLGMKSLNSALFKNKDWSTSSVYKDSLRDLEDYKVKVLNTKNDIDVLDDIKEHPAFQKFI